MTQEEVDTVVNYTLDMFNKDHPYLIYIDNKYWSDYVSQQRIKDVVEVAQRCINAQLHNGRWVAGTGAMRWGRRFHQEVLIDARGELV